jgi:outer membrane receptor for ferrienterochelin and colicins
MPTPASQFRFLSIYGFLFLSSSASAQAQENKAVAPEVTASQSATKDNPQQVEIKAKSEVDNARRDTAAKTVITNEVLMRFGDTNINDAMKRVPGVLVVKDQLQLPGMNAGYTQILVDGEPPRGITIADLPMNLIERVEIYRAGNAQFSSQAIAGTINIILKRVPSSKQAQTKINIANSYKTNTTFEWLNSDKFEHWSYSLSVVGAKLDGLMNAPYSYINQLFDADGQLIQGYQTYQSPELYENNLRINPRIQFKTPGGTAFTSTSSVILSHTQFNNDVQLRFDFGPSLPSGHILRSNLSKNYTINSGLRAVGSWEKIKFDISTGVNSRETKSDGEIQVFTPQSKEDYQRYINTKTNSFGWNNSGKITAPSNEEHDIVGGWTVSASTSSNNRHETQVNKLVTSTTVTDQLTDSRIQKSAVFIQDEWKFRKASSAYFGLRWESIQIQSESTIQEKMQHRSSVLSPIVQTLWQLNPENTDRLRLGLSRTYQAPFDFYLISPIFRTINNSISSPNFRGNPSLRPELAWAIDAAYEHNGKDEWNYTIRTKLRSINGLHREDISFFENAWWRRYINAGHAISKSIEFETQFPLKRFFESAPNLDINFDFNKTWSKVDYLPEPNNILAPSTLNGKLNLDYRAKDWPLSMGANLRYADSHWQQTSTTNSEKTGTSFEADVYSLWKFSKQTQLRLSIDNLFKRRDTYLSEQVYEGIKNRSIMPNPALRRVSLNYEHKF